MPFQKSRKMIEKALKNLKIEQLNEMQEASLKAAKNKTDIILLSPTGSGKTLGFILPLIQSLNPELKQTQALILSPSRELALQIEQVFRQTQSGFKITCCYGGHDNKTELNSLSQNPEVIVGTPGKIANHIREANINSSKISFLVLDEFDKSLELGFKEDMKVILDDLENLKMRFLTSATQAIDVPAFVGIKNAVTLNFLKDQKSNALALKAVKADGNDKLSVLFQLICSLGNDVILVFCNHRDAVDRISELLHEKGLGHDVFHGGMEQDDREKALIKFRNGTHQILLTTDLASRGLDIPEIKHVIHYQLPAQESAYVHRNGRTARMHAEGTSWLVFAEDEQIPNFIKSKPQFITPPQDAVVPSKSDWATLFISSGKKDKVNKVDIVGLILQKGGIKKEELGLIEVLDRMAFAAVKRDKIKGLMAKLKNEKLKGIKVKLEEAR